MASKLRRAPLFGLDNPLGIPVLPKYSSAPSSSPSGYKRCQATSTSQPIQFTKPTTHLRLQQKSKTSNTTSGMEVGVASFPQGNPVARGSPDSSARSSPRSNLHVGFAQVGEMKERKEKYLTAKYGAHQMSLIRKRLGVEMWMYDQLQVLYQCPKEGKSDEKEIDLDELLDTEEESCRRKFLQKKLLDCKQSPPDKVEKFINELLERAKTL